MGVAWRAGDIVLKPSPSSEEARYVAETHFGLRDTSECRFQRPVAPPHALGDWEIDGWAAWRWIEGEPAPERAREIVLAARAYHNLLSPLPVDPIFSSRNDPWARADRVAWGEVSADYPADYLALLAPLLADPPPLLRRQVVHADLTGNVVFASGLAPGIIDPTLYWRPVEFAEAIVLVDQSWFTSALDIAPFADTPAIAPMLRLAAARRIAEQPEQVAANGKCAADAFAVARQIASWAEAALNCLGSAN
ncbi:MAG: hypothetical protein AAF415_01970 [Pseudomonadota bacterium]